MYVLKILVRKLSLYSFLFLTNLISCDSKSQTYSDQNDYGYKGKIKSITTRSYYRFEQLHNSWKITDTASYSSILIKYFNEDGNFVKRIETTEHLTYQYIYSYSNKIKIGWTQIDNKGNVESTAKFTYNGKSSFTETEYNKDSDKISEHIYTIDESTQRTKTLEDIVYSYDSHKKGQRHERISFHLFTVFHDAKDGQLDKVTSEDKLRGSIDNYEFEIIEKDRFDNPIKILVKTNGTPTAIRKSVIKYSNF